LGGLKSFKNFKCFVYLRLKARYIGYLVYSISLHSFVYKQNGEPYPKQRHNQPMNQDVNIHIRKSQELIFTSCKLLVLISISIPSKHLRRASILESTTSFEDRRPNQGSYSCNKNMYISKSYKTYDTEKELTKHRI
jgi:hypothetical protein